ncbi:MAG: putative metalloprotease CJM1_0395 family protein [Alphaproteobacteria bacterium]
MHAGIASTSNFGGGQLISNSRIEDEKDLPFSQRGDGVDPSAQLVGDVEIAADGTAGIVIAATIVGYVPSSGLMVQVQLAETKDEAEAAADASADRVARGEPAKETDGVKPAVQKIDHLSLGDQSKVEELKARDVAVRQEKQAFAAQAGAMAGPIFYAYETGPDGRRYVVDGEVSIRTPSSKGGLELVNHSGRRLSREGGGYGMQSPSGSQFAAAAAGYRMAGSETAAERSSPVPIRLAV